MQNTIKFLAAAINCFRVTFDYTTVLMAIPDFLKKSKTRELKGRPLSSSISTHSVEKLECCLFYVCFTLTMYLTKNPVNRSIFTAEIIAIFSAELTLQVKTYKVSLFKDKLSHCKKIGEMMGIHSIYL